MASKPKKAADLARKIWRTQGKCESCGKTSEAGYKMDGAHLFGAGAYIRISSDIRNGYCLCFNCHRRFHSDSFAFNQFINSSWAVEYLEILMEKRRPGAKIDWDGRIEFLQSVLRQMAAGELTIEQARKLEDA